MFWTLLKLALNFIVIQFGPSWDFLNFFKKLLAQLRLRVRDAMTCSSMKLGYFIPNLVIGEKTPNF